MINNKLKSKECVICGRAAKDGIVLKEKFICRECELKIIKSNVEDKDYNIYANKIKDILFK